MQDGKELNKFKKKSKNRHCWVGFCSGSFQICKRRVLVRFVRLGFGFTPISCYLCTVSVVIRYALLTRWILSAKDHLSLCDCSGVGVKGEWHTSRDRLWRRCLRLYLWLFSSGMDRLSLTARMVLITMRRNRYSMLCCVDTSGHDDRDRLRLKRNSVTGRVEARRTNNHPAARLTRPWRCTYSLPLCRRFHTD